MKKTTDAIVRFDDTAHFEIVDDRLVTELGPQDAELVFGGATQSNNICRENLACVGPGPTINVQCDTDGRRQYLTHGNHTLNVIC